MKRYLLLLFYAISSMAMQSPDFTNQFIAAIREANLEKVKTMLDTQPSVQKSIRDYYNFTAEPILKFAVRNPELKPRYMQIARYLVDRGARVHPDVLEQLQAYEASQKPAPKPAASPKPLLTPITKPATPATAPAPKPVAPIAKPAHAMPVTPVPAPTIKPVSKPTGKTPAVYNKFSEIARLLDFDKAKKYLDSHDISNLTVEQKQEIMEYATGNLIASNAMTPEILNSRRRTILLLQKNGLPITGVAKIYYDRSQKGDFGPRAGTVESLLNIAIKNKDLNRVKQLVEQEDADVNATDGSRLSPLIVAAQAGAEAIAKYLYSQGARLYENNYYENRQFKPVLQKWGIPVN